MFPYESVLIRYIPGPKKKSCQKVVGTNSSTAKSQGTSPCRKLCMVKSFAKMLLTSKSLHPEINVRSAIQQFISVCLSFITTPHRLETQTLRTQREMGLWRHEREEKMNLIKRKGGCIKSEESISALTPLLCI